MPLRTPAEWAVIIPPIPPPATQSAQTTAVTNGFDTRGRRGSGGPTFRGGGGGATPRVAEG